MPPWYRRRDPQVVGRTDVSGNIDRRLDGELQGVKDRVLALTVGDEGRFRDVRHGAQVGHVAADAGFPVADDLRIRHHQRPPRIAPLTAARARSRSGWKSR